MTDNAWIDSYRKEIDEEGYVPFNHDRRLGQSQYASRSVDGRHRSTNHGDGLRWKFGYSGDASDYHSIRIHIDDLEEFHRRFKADNDQIMSGV